MFIWPVETIWVSGENVDVPSLGTTVLFIISYILLLQRVSACVYVHLCFVILTVYRHDIGMMLLTL
jgi:hypothetical protein